MPVLFKKFLLEALSIAVSAGVALSPPPAGLETEAMWVAGLLVWTLLNLILRYIPDFVVLMMMSCMWVILHIMPFQQAFESFTGTTVWLLVGALGIGTAVTKSGLLTRVALCTMKLCSPTFSGQVFAMLASGVVLSPFIPSTTAKVAPRRGSAPWSLHPDSLLIVGMSDTGMSLTGRRSLEDGASSPASMIRRTCSSDRSSSV